jgi:hypothetical protein
VLSEGFGVSNGGGCLVGGVRGGFVEKEGLGESDGLGAIGGASARAGEAV